MYIDFNISEVERKKASNQTREEWKKRIPSMHMTHVYVSIIQIIHLYFALVLAAIAS